MENPYAPGAMPTYLAGRGTELTLIADQAARMRTLGRELRRETERSVPPGAAAGLLLQLSKEQ